MFVCRQSLISFFEVLKKQKSIHQPNMPRSINWVSCHCEFSLYRHIWVWRLYIVYQPSAMLIISFNREWIAENILRLMLHINSFVIEKSYINIFKWRVILAYPPFFLGIRYPLICNLLYQITKTSHLIVPFSHCIVLTSHMTVLLLHSAVSLFFFFTFDGTILTLYMAP